MMSKNISKTGSSLILVTVIAAMITIIAFGASRLALVQFAQSTADEDKIAAYYAAYAGIEDGLIRYRYNPDVETRQDKVFSFDLTSGTLNPNVNPENNDVTEGSIRSQWTNYDPFHQYYDLKINFREDRIGVLALDDDKFLLAKDNSLQLTGFSPNVELNKPHYLHYKFRFIGASCAGAVVQIQQITEGNTPTPYDQQTAVNAGGYTEGSVLLKNTSVSQLTNYIRLRPYGCDVRYFFEVRDSNSGGNLIENGMSGLKTYITATGYFGSAKRTLVAEVDRTSGRLISIYDFNLYAGTGNIQP